MAASDYFPDLPETHIVIERAFRDQVYTKITHEGVTKHRGGNFGKDMEPGSPTFNQNMIYEEEEFIPNKQVKHERKMLTLPTEKKPKPLIVEPKRLFIFSHPKVGKTENTAALPNNLNIDLEDGAENYECMSINVKKLALEKYGNDVLAALSEVRNAIVEANTKAGKSVYDFITIDTSSALERMAIELANINYRKSNIGKKFEGGNILTELEYGGGYGWLRDAFTKLYNSFQALPAKSLIILGHVKLASINKNGKDLQAKDIDLIGKDKQIICSDMDAIGWLYRNKESYQNMLSFQTNEMDLATGARPEHLSGKEFILSEKFELDGKTPFVFDKTNPSKKGVIKTYWDHIFPSIKK